MHTDRYHQTPSFKFSQNSSLKCIQQFVETKIHLPNFIESLKFKEIKKLQIQKSKSFQQNLQKQIRKFTFCFEKFKKTLLILKQSALIKDQQIFKTEQKILLMQENIKKFLHPSKVEENNGKLKKNHSLSNFLSEIKNLSQTIQNERGKFKQIYTIEKQKLQIQVLKHQNINSSLKTKETFLNQSKRSLVNLKEKISVKQKSLNGLRHKKNTLLEKLKFIQSQKISKFKFIERRDQRHTKKEKQCVEKLQKFAQQLQSIIDNSTCDSQQKKNLIDVLVNVYCLNEKTVINFENNFLFCAQKDKHDSIQTTITVDSNYNQSQDILVKNNRKEPNIPIIIQHSLDRFWKEVGNQQILIKSSKKFYLKKQSSNQFINFQKSMSNPYRNSLPSSLNQKDLQNQFIQYCSNQLSSMRQIEQNLDKRQRQIEKQINFLKQKSNQKDLQIHTIIDQNRKSSKKK